VEQPDHGDPDGIPAELSRALASDAPARAAFEVQPPSLRREYARWVAAAAREETRRRRATRAVERIRSSRPPEP